MNRTTGDPPQDPQNSPRIEGWVPRVGGCPSQPLPRRPLCPSCTGTLWLLRISAINSGQAPGVPFRHMTVFLGKVDRGRGRNMSQFVPVNPQHQGFCTTPYLCGDKASPKP